MYSPILFARKILSSTRKLDNAQGRCHIIIVCLIESPQLNTLLTVFVFTAIIVSNNNFAKEQACTLIFIIRN